VRVPPRRRRCRRRRWLYAIQPARRRIVSFGPDGDEQTVAAEVDAVDLVLTAGGVVYGTDPVRNTVLKIDSRGVVTTVYAPGALQRGMQQLGPDELQAPHALALSADQAFLYVLDATSKFGWSFKIAPDGSLVEGVARFRLEWSEQDRWGRWRASPLTGSARCTRPPCWVSPYQIAADATRRSSMRPNGAP
jgi:sugar lactone lactonase YvrE